MKNPCYQCSERRVGCHANCERHAEWRAAHKKEKDREYAEKERDRLLIEHVITEKERIRRTHKNIRKG